MDPVVLVAGALASVEDTLWIHVVLVAGALASVKILYGSLLS